MEGVACVRYDTFVSDQTEVRIHELCKEALAAKDQADLDRIIPQLRVALTEHLRETRESLEAQASLLRIS
jgi:hypothetical protein